MAGVPIDPYLLSISLPQGLPVPNAEHASAGTRSSGETTSPSSASLEAVAAESSGHGMGINDANDHTTSSHAGSIVDSSIDTSVGDTSPAGHFDDDDQFNESTLTGHTATAHPGPYVGSSLGKATLDGHYTANGEHVPCAVSPRFATDYASPYASSAVPRTAAPGLCDKPDLHAQTSGFNRPGLSSDGSPIQSSAANSPAGTIVENFDSNNLYDESADFGVAGTSYDGQSTSFYGTGRTDNAYDTAYRTEDNPHSIYPDIDKPRMSVGPWFGYQPQFFTETGPLTGGDYGTAYQHMDPTQQQMATDQYMDSDQYMATDQYMDHNQYMDRNQQMTDHQEMAPTHYLASQSFEAEPQVGFGEANPESASAAPRKQKHPKKTGGLFVKGGSLKFPKKHYREYINGMRVMNGQTAQSQLAPTPCKCCAQNGLTCRVLKREGDLGKVFSGQRKHWHNQEVCAYIVCGNCWAAGVAQTCSFWRRPVGKEVVPKMPLRGPQPRKPRDKKEVE